jgi:polyhydroxyalkanoate synthesis regulator phasin
MPAPKSSSQRTSSAKSSSKRTGSSARTGAKAKSKNAHKPQGRASSQAKPGATKSSAGVGDGLASFAEQLANRIIKPLDLVLLTRERIQETLDEAAERGRVTRSDANELVSELVRRGRQQTDDLLNDLEHILDRGREQLESATRRARRAEPVDRLVRGADRARRTVGAGPSFPVAGYDDLTAAQVGDRLEGLRPAELRTVREYERRHLNRKSVLAALEKALA